MVGKMSIALVFFLLCTILTGAGTPVGKVPIAIDGLVDDWALVPVFLGDDNLSDLEIGTELEETRVDHNNNSFYFLLHFIRVIGGTELKTYITLDTPLNGVLVVSVETDGNTSTMTVITGMQLYSTLPVGNPSTNLTLVNQAARTVNSSYLELALPLAVILDSSEKIVSLDIGFWHSRTTRAGQGSHLFLNPLWEEDDATTETTSTSSGQPTWSSEPTGSTVFVNETTVVVKTETVQTPFVEIQLLASVFVILGLSQIVRRPKN